MVVIAITGPPGSGKTTIAKLLSEELKAEYVNLIEYAKKYKDKYIVGHDPIRDTYIVDENALIKDIEDFISNNKNKNIVIESHFSHLINKKLVDLFIYLVVDPNEQYKRLRERGYKYHKIFENIFATNLNIIEEELKELGIEYIRIDTTNSNPRDIVNKILNAMGLG